jgi:hypothetical protein
MPKFNLIHFTTRCGLIQVQNEFEQPFGESSREIALQIVQTRVLKAACRGHSSLVFEDGVVLVSSCRLTDSSKTALKKMTDAEAMRFKRHITDLHSITPLEFQNHIRRSFP